MTKRACPTLDPRLAAAADLVPAGLMLLDVGTDHGYLPAYLILSGKIPRAGASDINKAPLERAVCTAERFGVDNKMSFYLSDGTRGVPDIEKYGAISICGMGGELIARIVDECESVFHRRIPLILQPMSGADRLSVYLAGTGFNILDERISFASGKLYRTLLAVFDGKTKALSPAEHILGRINIERGGNCENFAMFLKKNIKKYEKIIDGKKLGGKDCSSDTYIYSELCSIAEKAGVAI